VEVQNDSVQLRLVNTDIRTAIQAIGRYLPKPIITGSLGDVRVTLFETPAFVPLSALPGLLEALVEANGLTFTEDSTLYSVTRPPVAPADAQLAEQARLELFTLRLRHARAADVAATLNQLFGAGGDFSRPAGLSTGSLSDELRASRTGARGGDAQQAPSDATLQRQVTMVADQLTNALLIRATAADFELLQQAVAQLDVRPLQVLIEAVVVEARKDRDFSMGFDVEVPPQDLAGGTIEGDYLTAGLGSLVARVMGMSRFDINATLALARQRGDVEILSRPVLLASNNTEASLLVGTQQPFVSVSRSLPTDTPQRDQVVQYIDVGTKLTILPTINEDGYVSLVVQQEMSAATGEMQFSAPVISSRETSTQVLVRDGQTVVIGGLRDEVHDEIRTGIPLLVDIPLLGSLFGGTRIGSTETELFLFLTPTILADDDDIDAATLQRVPEALDGRDLGSFNVCDPTGEPCREPAR
jgi:general secretion pathway protein D